MSVRVELSCDGCFEKVEGTDRLRKRFHGLNGRDYGFGVYAVDEVETVTPDGWVAFDPYTQCTYCPECVASIWPDSEVVVASAEPSRESGGSQ